MAADLSGFVFKIKIPSPKLDLKGKTDKQKAAMKKALTTGVSRGLGRVETSLSKALDDAMRAPVWNWTSGVTTFRQNGEAPSSPRNIVDTGELMRSKKIKVAYLQTGGTVSVTYGAPYAALVHYGGAVRPYGKPGRSLVTVPKRPWIEATINGGYGIEKFDADKIINTAIQEAWTAQFG